MSLSFGADLHAVSVDTTGQTTVVLKRDGSLWAWGKNDQLPITTEENEGEMLASFTKIMDGVKVPEGIPGQSGGASQTGSSAGQQPQISDENPFTDVAEGAYYYDAVLWAYENGITTGVSATAFNPNGTCTSGSCGDVPVAGRGPALRRRQRPSGHIFRPLLHRRRGLG